MNNLEFLKSEIEHYQNLKFNAENTMFNLVKLYSTVLTAFVIYTGFFIEKVSGKVNEDIFATIGLIFMIFIIATGYYLSTSLSHNIKKRILYTKEIVNIRKMINESIVSMKGMYTKNTVFPIDYARYPVKHFNDLPNIAFLLNLPIPIVSYYFIKAFGCSEIVTFSLTGIIVLITGVLIPNNCKVHSKQIYLAKNIAVGQDEISREKTYDLRLEEQNKKRSYIVNNLLYKSFLLGTFLYFGFSLFFFVPDHYNAVFGALVFVVIGLRYYLVKRIEYFFNDIKGKQSCKGSSDNNCSTD